MNDDLISREAALRADIGKPITGDPVTLTYRNWRGEVSVRTIVPHRVWFGSTDWHPEPQWLLSAFDCEKGEDRDFALKDFGQPVAPAVKVKPLVWVSHPTDRHQSALSTTGLYLADVTGWRLAHEGRWHDADNMEAAKAAAQADYEARILAALEAPHDSRE